MSEATTKPKRILRYRPEDPAKAVRALFDALREGELVYVGIDPGQTGSIAFLPGGRRLSPVALDMPVLRAKVKTSVKGKASTGVRTSYNYALLLEVLDPLIVHRERVYVALERGQPMPGDSGMTGFSVGCGYHMWQLFFAAFAIAWEEIRPAAWKKAMGLTSQDKDSSRRLAMRSWPAATHYFSCKGDHNRAEAVLLAEYLRRRQGGGNGG